MRSLLLIPLAAAVAAGCGSPSANPEVGRVPQRDLTLQQAGAPQIEVASPVELARAAPVEHRTGAQAWKVRRTARATAPSSSTPAPAVADVAVSTPAASAAAVPASPASYQPPDPYALAPGQTVTVLPASNGAGAAPASTPDDGPPDAQRGDSRGVTRHGGGHGGGCGGRGGHPGGSPGFRGLR